MPDRMALARHVRQSGCCAGTPDEGLASIAYERCPYAEQGCPYLGTRPGAHARTCRFNPTPVAGAPRGAAPRGAAGPAAVGGSDIRPGGEAVEGRPEEVPEETWDWLMSLQEGEVLVIHDSSLEEVPKQLRPLFTRCFMVVAREAVSVSPQRARRGWRALSLLAAMLLGRSAIVAGVAAESMACAVRDRCQRFLRGEWASLLPTREAEPTPPGSSMRGPAGGRRSEERIHADAVRLASKGELGRAMMVLDQKAMAPANGATFQALEMLNPPRSPLFPAPVVPPAAMRTPALELDRESFDAMFQGPKRLPRGSAPGASQTRFEHLEAIYWHGGADDLFTLCSSVVKGEVPEEEQGWFAGARLLALCKDGSTPPPAGAVRPIACGEAIRRLCARAVCFQKRSDFGSFFARPAGAEEGLQPVQLGVAVAGGADILVHTVQAALEQHPEWAYGTIDIANAYNEVSRAVIERELLAHFPDLWSFYKVCYGGAPDLVFGVWDQALGSYTRHVIPSAEGVQQGDPLACVYFALALHPALRSVAERHGCRVAVPLAITEQGTESRAGEGLSLASAFFDDTSLLGPPEAVAAAMRDLFELVPALMGARVREDKCLVYSTSGDLSGFPPEVRGSTAAREDGSHGTRLQGFALMGAPIGTDAYVEEWFRVKFDAWLGPTDAAVEAGLPGMLGCLSRLPDPQTVALLVQFCASPKVSHLLRAVAPRLSATPGALPRYHAALCALWAGPLAGVARGPYFSDRALRALSLPPRMGGGGLTDPRAHAHSSFLASWVQAWGQMSVLHPHALADVRLTGEEANPTSSPIAPPTGGVVEALRVAHGQVAGDLAEVRQLQVEYPAARLPAGSPPVSFVLPLPEAYSALARIQTPSSRAVAAITHTKEWLALRRLCAEPRERAWLNSVSFDSVGADFMRVIPSYALLRIEPADFPIAVRHHFMEPQPVVDGVERCGGCGQPMHAGDDGQHYVQCGPGAHFTAIHNAVVRGVRAMVRDALSGVGRVLREEDYYGHHGYSPHHRPDITAFDYDGRGSTLVVEASCIRPTSATHVAVACGAPGAALEAWEAYRLTDYHQPERGRFLPPATHWRPFVFDTFGALGPGTWRFFRALAERQQAGAVARGGLPLGEHMSWSARWKGRLSVVLAVQVAQTVRRRAAGDHPSM